MLHTTDSKRFRPQLCGLLVALWAFCAGCEIAEEPVSEGLPGNATDAGSLSMPATAADAQPLDSGASEAGPSDSAQQSPAPSDAGPLGTPSWDAGPVDAGDSARDAGDSARDEQDKEAGQTPLADAAPSDRDGSAPSADAATDAAPSQADALGPSHVFSVDSKAEWTPSGFQVEAGKCYSVQAKIDNQWLDSDIEANLDGWADQSNFLIGLFAEFRRVQQDDIGFYQFATCVDQKLDQCFPIHQSSNICPRVSGELFFFVNDAPGFEDNNVGTATVTILAK